MVEEGGTHTKSKSHGSLDDGATLPDDRDGGREGGWVVVDAYPASRWPLEPTTSVPERVITGQLAGQPDSPWSLAVSLMHGEVFSPLPPSLFGSTVPSGRSGQPCPSG